MTRMKCVPLSPGLFSSPNGFRNLDPKLKTSIVRVQLLLASMWRGKRFFYKEDNPNEVK